MTKKPGVQRDFPRVMFVDDEKDIAAVIKNGLERYNIKVDVFTNPLVALDHFRDHSQDYDMILSDIRMPGLTGFQLVRAIKDLNPDVKIIMLTAFEIDKSEFSKVLPSTKVDDFVHKPIRPEALREIIMKHMDRKDISG